MYNNDLNVGDAMQANLGFVLAQTTHVETEVYKLRFPQIRYPGLIPIDYSAPDWIQSVTYYSMDIAGEAGWTGDRSSDINVVGTSMEKHETRVHMADIGYDYGIEEVNQATLLGMNLSGDKAAAARLIYERKVDNVAFMGDGVKNFTGLFNNPNVTVTSATTGGWQGSTATERQILEDVNELISGVYAATNEIAIADTLLLPSLSYQFLASTLLPESNGKTLLQFLKESNVYKAETGQDLNIRGVRGLDDAGVGDTKRMVAYRNSKEVLKMHVPMRHRFLPVQMHGLTYKIPGIFRLGGLDIRLPREVRYSDGI